MRNSFRYLEKERNQPEPTQLKSSREPKSIHKYSAIFSNLTLKRRNDQILRLYVYISLGVRVAQVVV